MIGKAMARTARTLSGLGLTLGALFFAASLTPSLVPRTYLTQGVLAGTCFALGYGLGAGWRRLWAYLELPALPERWRRAGNAVAGAVCLAVAASFLWRAAGWQNSIRSAMAMPPVETAHPLKLCLVALATFAALLALARLFRLIAGLIAARLGRAIPPRLAKVLGLMVAAVLFWSLANGVLVRATFRVLDSSFREYDALIEPERPQPDDPQQSGSASSLLRWRELGRAGREFVASRPLASDIAAVTGRPARQPLRLYVGLRAAGTAQARARLALAELKRAGGFERAVLVVITPTGTGWIDPSAMNAVEYLHDGDVASIALQYSYLSSPLSLLAQPDYGAEAARALFDEIYRYWTTLPHDGRPRLYLHGLSLGAMNSERSAELFEMIGDPVDGALWSGPPFGSRLWRSFTEGRNPGTPAWLPTFRDGRFVRFMNQQGGTLPARQPWGAMRVVYLQYASDAVTFFDYRDFYRAPAWLDAPRGPDVSPRLRWYPVVTALQLALDMAFATTTPMGYGHVYAPRDYIDAWVAVTAPRGWSAETLERLKRRLSDEAERGSGSGQDDAGYGNRGG
ncbi:alpha/beta-hydrolase family protein [Bosea sp. (in: a-proteobacteria)]|uniref:alpha/beta hydrolase n=1 Tax=Bosea sp. (in: a-proteobacteria) TaxID=1871050 RepID=UPI001AC2B090|nr:alpha/beta-hydrolase family protein [Bosea sp. (in: a-proteobacteria)]MBN9443213.1 alpha/beta-hydrolase family protein [Bosea sp. (in: a-proteobacteria)]